MARTGQADEAGRLHARVDVAGSGEANVATGVPVLDHLIGLMAQYGSFDMVCGNPDTRAIPSIHRSASSISTPTCRGKFTSRAVTIGCWMG